MLTWSTDIMTSLQDDVGRALGILKVLRNKQLAVTETQLVNH